MFQQISDVLSCVPQRVMQLLHHTEVAVMTAQRAETWRQLSKVKTELLSSTDVYCSNAVCASMSACLSTFNAIPSFALRTTHTLHDMQTH
jgi:hypothetical protein